MNFDIKKIISKTPEYIWYVINVLIQNGFEGYIVGGCVRDILIGVTPKDYDITTNAHTDDIISIFKNNHTIIPTGIKHGTVSLVLSCDFINENFKDKTNENVCIEITTFREDLDYKDNRHPEKVVFVNEINGDLSRRDFTINAMAFGKKDNLACQPCFIDLFDGRKDIENKIIRTVGNPQKRFNEDGLRIMRALRFASVLEYNIEKSTQIAILNNKELLKNISVERIRDEFCKLLVGKNATVILEKYFDVFCVFIKNFDKLKNCLQNTPYHKYDVLGHTLATLKNSKQDLILRLIMLFHDFGKPFCKTTDGNGIDHFKGHQLVSEKIAKENMRHLKFDNQTIEKVCLLIKYHDLRPAKTEKSIKKVLAKIGEDNFILWLNVKRCDNSGQSDIVSGRIEDFNVFEQLYNKIVQENQCFKLKNLAINGKDLMNLGIKQGESIGIILNEILQKVIDEKLINDKTEILNYISKKYL